MEVARAREACLTGCNPQHLGHSSVLLGGGPAEGVEGRLRERGR